jgi:hypothetical protein
MRAPPQMVCRKSRQPFKLLTIFRFSDFNPTPLRMTTCAPCEGGIPPNCGV